MNKCRGKPNYYSYNSVHFDIAGAASYDEIIG